MGRGMVQEMDANQLTIPLTVFISVLFGALAVMFTMMKFLRHIEEGIGLRIGKLQSDITSVKLDLSTLATRQDINGLGKRISNIDNRLTVVETTNEITHHAVGGE